MLLTKTICTMYGVHMRHIRRYTSGASACGALCMRIYAHCSCYRFGIVTGTGELSSLPSPLSNLCSISKLPRLLKHPRNDCESDSDSEDVPKLKTARRQRL